MSDLWLERAVRPEDCGTSTRFLYRTMVGRAILSVFTLPFISKAVGAFLDSSLSRPMIRPFIRNNGIDMSDYPDTSYPSFNSFFMRRIRDGARPVAESSDDLCAPCDSRLSAYRIDEDSTFMIKDSPYTICDLLGGNSELAEHYRDGVCLIFRLCVTDYHRYMYFDDCSKEEGVFIPGRLHTVRPIALEHYNIYKRNSREYCVLNTEHFGKAVQVEVGALLVGRIANDHTTGSFHRGEEKGKFMFGGSTIVLLLQKDAAKIDAQIVHNTQSGLETIVRMGERIGKRDI